MIKLIALDLDDTLLMPDCTIPEEAISALRAAAAQGIKTVIATGRSFPSARLYAAQISSDCPVVCYNGSVIASASGEILFSSLLSPDLMHRVAVFCKNHSLYLQMYSNDKIVIEKDCREFRIDPDSKIADFIELGDLTKAELMPSPKMMILDTPERLAEIRPELEAQFGEELHLATSKEYLLEMMPKNISKSKTLSILSDRLGISRQEVMACGDNTNDMEMLHWAGIGVAVANAVKPLRDIADYVSQAERSFGVIEAVEKFAIQRSCAP